MARPVRRAIPPKVKGIQHVAIAVPSLDAALPVYRDLFGFELHGIEHVVDQKVRVAVLVRGAHRIELVEPAASDSPISKFLDQRGAGLHHLCFDVQNLDAILQNLKGAGVPLIDDAPRPGADGRRVAFVHPRGTGGVLIELSESPPPKPEPPSAAPAPAPGAVVPPPPAP